MRCPHCSNQDSKVIESRDASESGAIRRRRECLKCGTRYTTYERVERPNLAIVKKDGARELFDRNKLFAAIHRSVGKFLSSDLEVDAIVSKVENELYARGDTELPSTVIGDLVLAELGERNQVAYVRFASVYQEFKTVDEFADALEKLRKKK
ncbi:MAG: transcriptional regulator NrdR [Candidatus Saccharibacteria bacterium]|nr:transcriptional regulator NrdR [Candidatus Saccharibacteria bacterium]